MSVWVDWAKSVVGIEFTTAVASNPLFRGTAARIEERRRQLPWCISFCAGRRVLSAWLYYESFY
jgi:hypothetical protein